MSWPVLPYGFLATQGSSENDTYQVPRSLRFNETSKYLTRTLGTPTNNRIFTYSGWLKPACIAASTRQPIFTACNSVASLIFALEFTVTTKTLQVWDSNYTSGGPALVSSQVFRDPTAWMHVVMAVDTTQATASNRVKLYVNGAQVTAFSSANYAAQNSNPYMNSAVQHSIGSWQPFSGGNYDGYMAELNFVDGQALTPSSFGETEPVTGRWRPIAYTGTYGNNGFYIPFSRNQAPQELGIDQKTGSFTGATGGLPILNQSERFLTSGVASDSNASSLVLALPLDTTANLTADQSPTGRTASTKSVTNASVTATPGVYEYYGTGSALFNGTTSRLTVPNSADFQFGTGDFTIEGFVNSVALKANAIFAKCSVDTGWTAGWTCEINSGYITFYDGIAGVRYAGATNLMAINNWYHVAWSRQSGSLRMFVNGNLVRTDTITSNFAPTVNFILGNDITTNTYALNAYFQDFRIYKGVAKYTAAFVVPNFNDFTASGSPTFSVTPYATNDSLVDSPTIYGTDTGLGGEVRGNYATLNPISPFKGTILNGNLSTNAGFAGSSSTIGMSSGKWYCEEYITAVGTESSLGITKGLAAMNTYVGASADSWGYYFNGQKYTNGSPLSYGSAFTTGDTVGAAFDADNGTIIFYKNGISQGTAYTGLTSGPYFFACSGRANNVTMNFGQQTYQYAAPSGYKALCSTNFPTPAVPKSSAAMDIVTYTGTGASLANSSLGFNPDLVWIKSRSSAANHAIYDSVRGATKDMSPNTTAAETTEAQGLTSFDSAGFTIGTLAKINTASATYVAWAWDESVTAGFDIVSYVGNGANRTISHALGVTPKCMIVRDRTSAAYDWVYYNAGMNATPQNGYMALNSNIAYTALAGIWNNTAPTSSNFSVGTNTAVNASGDNYIAYLWADVEGFSKFGSFVGNGAADGVFVYCGFRPKYVLLHNATTGTYLWQVYDGTRDTYNVVGKTLYPNATAAEGADASLDFLSNGFKCRSASYINDSGSTIVYSAFAEAPFKYARAR